MKRMFLPFTLIFTLIFCSTAFAVVKTGATCTKLGATSIVSGKKYTCIKSGKKFIWNKGVLIKSPETKSDISLIPSQTLKFPVSDKNAYLNSSMCKLTNSNRITEIGVSHDKRSSIVLDPNKPIRALVFFVDFPDLQNQTNGVPDLKYMTSRIDDFYSSQSNGKVKFVWTYSQEFNRLESKIESYGVGADRSGENWRLNYDIQELAFKKYPRENFDVILEIPPQGTRSTQISNSQAFPPKESKYLSGAIFSAAIWTNSLNQWSTAAHEIGHLFGLADLYDYEISNSSIKKDVNHFLGPYDLMNHNGVIELTVWNRWIANFITDNQILCLPDSLTISYLRPIEKVNNEVKGLIIRTSATTAIAIENREFLGFDTSIAYESTGVIVYTIDTQFDNGQGPMRLVQKPGTNESWQYKSALKDGDALSISGYQIKVLGHDDSGAYVQVSKIS